jgi:glycosyltransferase involved in cell wall biosynthesis
LLRPRTAPPALVSIAVPVYNEEGNVEALLAAIDDALPSTDFELVYVDDGSIDKSLEILEALARRDRRVRVISLSRNFGHQAALRAGMAEARGDVVITMDADLQHPPELIPELISRWQAGYDVVFTIRDDASAPLPWVKKASSKAFYSVFNILTDLAIDAGAADFRLLDRAVADVVNREREADLFMRGYIQWVGFEQVGLPYTPRDRFSGSSNYSLKKMFRLAGSGITQFSVRPLRLAYVFAALATVVALAYVIYAATMAATGRTIEGWLSLVVLIVAFQGIQFLLIGLIGEYLGRTFMQTKLRPDYIVAHRS